MASDSDGEAVDDDVEAMASIQAQPQALQSEDVLLEEEAGDENDADTQGHRQKQPDETTSAVQTVS